MSNENKQISSDNVTDVVELKKSKIIPSFGPVEQLKILETTEGGKFYTTDTYLLLNQERLEKFLGQDGYSNYLASLRPSLKNESTPMTDEDMLSTTKSRYCQSPAEIKAWTGELAARFQAAKDEYDRRFSETTTSPDNTPHTGSVTASAQQDSSSKTD